MTKRIERKKIIKNVMDQRLHDLLMNEEGTVPIEAALVNAKKRWRN